MEEELDSQKAGLVEVQGLLAQEVAMELAEELVAAVQVEEQRLEAQEAQEVAVQDQTPSDLLEEPLA